MVQVNTQPVTIRFRFRKVGSLMYISHLDLVRTFSKIVIRSGLPLWFTEGFNPKPKMVFSAPLSVGVESETEYLDLRLTERVDPADALARMNRNVTDELRMAEAYYPDCKLSDLAWLSYRIDIYTDGVTDDLAAACERTLTAPEVPVVKKNKDGEKTVDIRPRIREVSVKNENGHLHIEGVFSADQSSFLNPDLILQALKDAHGILSSGNLLSEYVTVLRTHAYRADMTDFR